MQTLWQDLRFGARMLRKQPGFTLIAVLTLALGIGATTAIFSIVNAVLLRPLPFAQSERIIALGQTYPEDRQFLGSASYRNFADWRAQNRSCEQMAAYNPTTFTLIDEGQPRQLQGTVATHDFFPLLRVQPVLGRVFDAADDQAGGGKGGLPVLLSWQMWQQQFGGDRNVLGRRLKLSGEAYTVIGVMPAGFAWPLTSKPMDVWTSLAVDAAKTNEGGIMKSRGYCTWNVFARLKAGVTNEQARADLDAIAAGLAQQFPQENKNVGVGLKPMVEEMTGSLRYALNVLFGAVVCVLLIACANVANLLVVRAAGRRREIAVRAALGASRWRIIRQLLTESVLLALAGGAVGSLLAVWGGEGLRLIAPEGIPRINETGLYGHVLLFTIGVSLLTGILFGLLPAWQAARADLQTTLKEGGGTATEGRSRQRLRSTLVVAELALSLLLLTGAGLLLQSFTRLQRVDPGFNPRNLLTFAVELNGAKYEKPESVIAFFDQFRERLNALPGVTAVTQTAFLPLSGTNPMTGFEINGRPNEPGDSPVAELRAVGNEYFSTMGIPLRQGRDFTAGDALNTPGVMVVNQAFAKKFFPNSDALGQRLKPGFGTYGIAERWYEIVGVVGDVRHDSLRSEPRPEFYFSASQMPFGGMTMVLRGNVNASAIIPAATAMLAEMDKDLPLLEVKTLDEYVARTLARSRMYMALLAIFAALAVLLAAIGLYGVISYAVLQRTHEIGIRIALGAHRADILHLIVGRGMKLVLAGIAVGVIASLFAARLLQSFLFGVTAADPMTFGMVAVLLLVVALLACWLPARRATKVDPMIALRCD